MDDDFVELPMEMYSFDEDLVDFFTALPLEEIHTE